MFNHPMTRSPDRPIPWERLRLKDRIAPGLRILFVGINPGVRSAQTGHHFAGPSNRFWKLLYESRLVPEPVTHEDDDRLPQWGLGVTNLVPRPSPGIDSLKPAEYVLGWPLLDRKIETYRPAVVALVGVTLWRAILPLVWLDEVERGAAERIRCPGPQMLTLHGAGVFVLPNPSGRNANFSYAEMLEAFRRLRRWTRGNKPQRRGGHRGGRGRTPASGRR
jgi:TDG/mug DNA glycosylase family protein